MVLAEVSTFKKLQEGPSLCPYLLHCYKALQEDGYMYIVKLNYVLLGVADGL